MMFRRSLCAAAFAGAMFAQPASAAWLEARADHFIVYSEGTETSVRAFAARLEKFDRGMRVLRSLPDQASDKVNPLIVYVVSDVGAIQKLCSGGRRSVASCDRVAGFYEPRAGGSVAFTPRRSGNNGPYDMSAQTVLFHEYTHHFLFANYAAAYPGWFSEGYAEFNSTADVAPDGSVGFGKPAMHRAYSLLHGKPLSLTAMLTADTRKLSPDQREALYGRGWLLTHYLMFDKTRGQQLRPYLLAINDGMSSLDAATLAFGDLKKLDHELDAYLVRPRMSYLHIDGGKLPVGAIAVRPLSAGETAMMPVRMRSARGVDTATAAEVVLDARRRAAPFAADPRVQDALAEAEYDAGYDDLAEAACDRALAVEPTAMAALLYKGRIHLRRARLARTSDPKVWQEARSWLVRANRAEPDAALPLLLFYESFGAARAKPTANAVLGLHRAFELAPQARGLRFQLARQYLVDGDLKAARAVLAPLAYDPHASPDNRAAQMMALIDRRDTATAAAAIGQAPADAGDDVSDGD